MAHDIRGNAKVHVLQILFWKIAKPTTRRADVSDNDHMESPNGQQHDCHQNLYLLMMLLLRKPADSHWEIAVNDTNEKCIGIMEYVQ